MLLGLARPAFGDDSLDIPIPLGFYFGPTLSSAAYSVAGTAEARRAKTAIQAGIFSQITLSDWLYFRPEIAFVQKGSRNAAGTVTRLNYFELPLLLEGRFSGEAFQLFFPVGLGVGYLTSGDTVTADGSIRVIDSASIAKVDVSFQAGAGLGYHLDNQWELFLMGRTSRGLTNIARFQVSGASTRYVSNVTSVVVGLVYNQPGFLRSSSPAAQKQ